MKIAAIYTGAVMIPTFSKMLKEAFPEDELTNLLDDSIVRECITTGQVSTAVKSRLIKLYFYAQEMGAELIINTCSSVGEVVALGSHVCTVPILRIDEPMVYRAIDIGSRIGVIATLESTLAPTSKLIETSAALMKKRVQLIHGLAEGAYLAAVNGNVDLHDQKIINTAISIANQCDVIVLAQGSMERMEMKLKQETGLPVLSSPNIFIEWLSAQRNH